jgi:hypothetical protein
MMEEDGIYSGTARWDDQEALASLFAPLPEVVVANIKTGHRESPTGFRGMRHDEPTARAFFVIADATHLQVWTFKPASFEEATLMWSLLDEAPQRRIDRDVAIQIYRFVTGRDTQHIH